MKNKLNKIANSIFRIFSIATVVSGVLVGITWYRDYQETKYWKSITEKKYLYQEVDAGGILPEYQALYEENSDLIGWIKIENTKIDYPVMQTKEEPQYYLRRNFDKKYDSLGTPFADYRCEVLSPRSYNVIIYGHYTDSDAMFRWLLNYGLKAWYEKNKIIQFDTLMEKGTYEVVAAFYYNASEVILKDFGDEKSEESYEFYNYIELDNAEGFEHFAELIEKRKLYETQTNFDETDELLTLICCAPKEYSGIEEEGRFVVVAKKV